MKLNEFGTVYTVSNYVLGPISYYNKQGFPSGFLPSKFLKSSSGFNEFGLKSVPPEVHRTLARTPAGLRAISLVQNVQDVCGAHPAS